MTEIPIQQLDTICFGGEDWWYHNRGHIDMQLVRRFAHLGTLLYVNSVVMQKPSVGKTGQFFLKLARKTRSIARGLRRSGEGFWVYSPLSLPVHHLRWASGFNHTLLRMQVSLVSGILHQKPGLVWVACPPACEAALRLRRTRLVYQRADRYEEFPGVDRQTISGFDRKLKAGADLTVFVSRMLYEQERQDCRKAFYLDHGVDFDLFASAESSEYVPEDMVGIPRPIIGFYGGFAPHTTDVALLEQVAELLPDKSFVFVGRPSRECERLTPMKNVRMLGQRPYEQIPHYGKCFDVVIMPWVQNEWIRGCNPVKLKEYLALGKPIVSTPFDELRKYHDVIYEARTAQDFARAIETALVENNADRIAARRQKVAHDTWDHKATMVLEQLFGDGDTAQVNIPDDPATEA